MTQLRLVNMIKKLIQSTCCQLLQLYRAQNCRAWGPLGKRFASARRCEGRMAAKCSLGSSKRVSQSQARQIFPFIWDVFKISKLTAVRHLINSVMSLLLALLWVHHPLSCLISGCLFALGLCSTQSSHKFRELNNWPTVKPIKKIRLWQKLRVSGFTRVEITHHWEYLSSYVTELSNLQVNQYWVRTSLLLTSALPRSTVWFSADGGLETAFQKLHVTGQHRAGLPFLLPC